MQGVLVVAVATKVSRSISFTGEKYLYLYTKLPTETHLIEYVVFNIPTIISVELGATIQHLYSNYIASI